MAHHDVELSTENLEHVGNDDIDIDIDLLTAQQDEDFILEDAASDRDIEDATVGNDDIMQDEENASYQMDDVDVMQEEHVENLQMEDAHQSKALGSGFTNAELSHNQADIREEYLKSLNGGTEAAMDDHIDHATILNNFEDEQVLEVQGVSVTDFVKRRETGVFQLLPQPPDSEENLISERQLEGQHASTSPRTKSPKSAGSSPQEIIGRETVSELTDPVAQSRGGVDPVTDERKYVSQLKVTVVWRDAEYKLMAASDADDPDSFFLKDVNLIKESFSGFIAALRDVVLDELNTDDELCLTIDDLGLEVTETSPAIYGMCFEDILKLYEKLLRNDGVEIPGPLYITMGTKPHFTKRLNNLVAGAANGKGLSELVSWNEGSQEVETDDQSIDPESNEQQVTDHGDNLRIVDESTDRRTDKLRPAAAPEEDAQDTLGQETLRATDEFKSAEEYVQADNAENSGGQITSRVSLPQNEQADLSALDQSTNSAGIDLIDYHTDDVDEDGDLIDYSDDGLLLNEEPIALADSHSLSQANEDSTIDAANKNLRQQSVSVATEQDKQPILHEEHLNDFANEQGIEQLEHGLDSYGGNEDGNEDSDGLFGHAEEEDSAAHVWNDEDEFDNEPKDGEESLDVNGHQDMSKEVAYDDEITRVNDSAIPATETMPKEDRFFEDGRGGIEDHGGIDHDVEIEGLSASTLNDDATASGLNNLIAENHAVVEAYVDPDEISYEETEGLNSNYSEQTLAADGAAQNTEGDMFEDTLHDEISYEDDDRQDVSISSEPKFNIETSPTINGQSGKRLRSDADGATDGGSKYSKRLRS